MYEVEGLDTLASTAYLERLNNPTPWTARMMAHYRGMSRGLCSITDSFGVGLGHAALFVRYRPAPEKDAALRKWLREEALPGLAARPGLASAHLFESGLTPQLTNEQKIRGKDAAVACALLVTGYSAETVAGLAQADLGVHQFEQRGASEISAGVYRMVYTLTERDVLGP